MNLNQQTALSPIQIEVLWNRLLSVANEQQSALIRTAFSTIVRESLDLACGIFDRRGRMIAQSDTGTPGHINPMATGVPALLQIYPPESLRPGDVLVTNDPWLTAGQINDFTVLTPVFRDGAIVAYFANCCHSADIGGRILSAEASEVFEEGLRVPVTKLFDAGEPNHELFKIIRANVRTPDETVGDLYAQATCNAVGARSLLTMLDEFGLPDIEDLADEIVGRSERAMRAAIRALPDGRWTHAVWSDGFEEPIELRVAVEIRGDELFIDFAGSSPQSSRGINVVLNYTRGYASFAMKAAVCPDVPHNHGSFLPVHVDAPRGSILNCVEPAAVASRHLVGHFLPGLIFGALAEALPGRLLAGGADPAWMSIWRGRWPDGRPFNATIFQLGGSGARFAKDGLDTTGFPSGVGGVPAEVIETLTPLVQHERRLRTDSGGPGRTRGGLGQDTVFTSRSHAPWSVSAMIDRTHFPAQGFAGGLPGAPGAFTADDVPQKAKSVVRFQPEARVRLALPGGAGWGSPRERDPQAVLRDVAAGYVSIEAARLHYGVDVRFTGDPARILRRPEEYVVEGTATAVGDRRSTVGSSSVVVFDIGGVLVQTLDLEPRRRWERRLSLPDWGLSDAVFGSDASRAAFVGQADADDVWREVAARFGLTDEERARIAADFWAGDAVNAPWIAGIAELQKRMPTAILSNAWRDMSLRDRRRIDMSGFSCVVYSWEERVRKPDPAIYERVLERLGVRDASQALFIDDFIENVEAARAVGMRAVQYVAGMDLWEVV
jgi:N-methylhydantoinase B